MDRKLFRLILISAIIVLAYSFLVSPLETFAKARLLSRDVIAKIVYKFSKPPKQVKDIVVVSIDLESLRNVDCSWPWPRSVFAEFLKKLKQYDPSVVYLDFSFIGESTAEEDDIFKKALEESGKTIIPFYFDSNGMPMLPFQKFIEASAGFGAENKLRDIDHSIRDMPLVYFSPEQKGRVIDYSAELIILCKYLGTTIGSVIYDDTRLIIDTKNINREVPLTREGIFHINFLTKPADISVVPFWKVIKEDLPKEIFKDKITIVGITDKAFIDTYPTPLGTASGVEIVTNTILTMLSEKYIYSSSHDVNLPLLLCFAILITITVFKLPPLKGFVFTVLEILGYVLLSILFARLGLYSEVFSILFVGIIVYAVTKVYKFIYLLEEQNVSLQKALKDLKEAEAELVQSEKLSAMGRLSAQISHEINNPICTIQNNVELIDSILDKGGKIEKVKEVTKRIAGELNRLSRLSRDILGFVRPPKDEIGPVYINSIVNDIVSLYRSQMEKEKVEISLDLDQSVPKTTAPRDKLMQVFSNLILNAQEAMSGGGKINITTRNLKTGFIEISFADTGCGMTSEVLKRIFEPFYTTKKGSKGTGLGLYTVHTIIKGLGGTINVTSTAGKGTTFKVSIPVKD
jgi:signal transduction histidine kinase